MTWLRGILGILAILMGANWILQGLNVIGKSAMSGHGQYAILGLIVLLIGIWLLQGAIRWRRAQTHYEP